MHTSAGTWKGLLSQLLVRLLISSFQPATAVAAG